MHLPERQSLDTVWVRSPASAYNEKRGLTALGHWKA